MNQSTSKLEDAPQVYTTTEAAKLCGVSQATMVRAVLRKDIRAGTTPGGHYRIREEDLADYCRQNNIPTPGAQRRDWRILIAEDNDAEQKAYLNSFRNETGFEVKATSSGFEAGFLVRVFRPDLLLLDIWLGDADGKRIVDLIRRDADLKNTKIAAITGESRAKQFAEIESCGVDAVIRKPVTPAELRQKVKELLGA